MNDISVLIHEYLHQKRRQIKSIKNTKNPILKITQQFKEKNFNVIKSKDIKHFDYIIEEYISLDIINNELLLREHNTFKPEISK
jgi:hypothetical protein